MSSIAVNQINQSQLAAFVVSTMTGGNFSGMLGAYLAGGGSLNTGVLSTTGGAQSVATAVTFELNPTVPYSGTTGQAPSLRLVQDKIQYYIDSLSGTMTGTYVTIVGNQNISDYKVFTGSVGVGAGTIGGHAATLAQLSGASGILAEAIAAGSVTQATLVATSGALLANTAQSGSTLYNQITGLVTPFDRSFYLSTFATGLHVAESFVSNATYITGVAISCRTSGTGPENGGLLTGQLYQVDFNNTQQTLLDFTLAPGVLFSGSPLLNLYVTGRNHIGLSITNGLSGIDKVCVGIFGRNQ